MTLPPLYKYFDIHGAKLTLRNRTFKHTKPSDFNDTEDMTIQSIFPEEIEVALERLASSFTDVILRHLDSAPTCSSPLKEQVALIQHVFRTNPEAVDVVKNEMNKQDGTPVYDVEHMRTMTKSFVAEINEFMQGYRVLCVTTRIDSERMWADYAENHKGIALRIEPNMAEDSKFQLFRPVIYREKRPPLFEDTLDFIADSLFGDQMSRRKAILEKIVYAKTLGWADESEYRLVIPLRQNEKSWDTLPYHPEEITELYCGLGMEKVDIDVGLAQAFNPNIAIFRAKRDASGKLAFDRV